ncbi:MAG: FTR1 family protein [Dehalococcoidia bacterium]|nr:FTR1 family protein [Dehalococcoidia bacterium]
MLPTFVIGLREGVEAALIVGVIAAFLRQRGATRELTWMWIGVVAAVVLCLGVGVLLEALNRSLPQRQQEQLETVIALVAVAMVTSMVLWLTRHARTLRSELEERAADALASGSAFALVSMAFLAVMREGLETALFLLAAFEVSGDRAATLSGAIAGIVVAVAIGGLIYQGGLRLNLARFFRATGLVLVLVAAGLVSFAMHTAHEAGWIEFGQEQALDLSWLIVPGSIQSALITGVLGIQPRPTVVEAVGWLVYFVPAALLVLRPWEWVRPARAMPTGRRS